MDGLHDSHFRDLVLFYEYFNGDNGKGLGASHHSPAPLTTVHI